MRYFSFPARVALVATASLVLGCATLFARGLDTTQQYTVQVDYAQSITDSLHSSDYGWVNPMVNATNYPESMTGSATLTAHLVLFNAGMSVADFAKAQTSAGFRPATLSELLAFAKANPQLPTDAPIIALGSSTNQWVLADGPDASTEVMKVQGVFYPFLGKGLMGGRNVNAAWTDDSEGSPLYTYSQYYALVVAQPKAN